MCTGKCSRCIGITLFPLAACAIVSNILLYFPNGQVLQLSEITDLVWFFQGILGAGILVILPAFMMLGAGGAGCCANRCGMLLSVLLALLGFAGGVYCAVFSSMGLIGGPLCDTGDREYLYPFRNNTLDEQMVNTVYTQTHASLNQRVPAGHPFVQELTYRQSAYVSPIVLVSNPLCMSHHAFKRLLSDELYNYLFNQTTWSICKEPENIVLWNIVLFSILLAVGVIEAILCLIQVTNGLVGFVCGTCMRRRKTNISGM